jgi:hypothetical protein
MKFLTSFSSFATQIPQLISSENTLNITQMAIQGKEFGLAGENVVRGRVKVIGIEVEANAVSHVFHETGLEGMMPIPVCPFYAD